MKQQLICVFSILSVLILNDKLKYVYSKNEHIKRFWDCFFSPSFFLLPRSLLNIHHGYIHVYLLINYNPKTNSRLFINKNIHVSRNKYFAYFK